MTDLDMQVTVTTLMYLLTPDSYTVLLLTGPQSCNGFPQRMGSEAIWRKMLFCSFLRPNYGNPPLVPTLSLCLERHPMV